MDDGRFRGRPLSFWDYSGPQGSRYSFDGGALAQLGERRLCKPEVTGSSPVRSMAAAQGNSASNAHLRETVDRTRTHGSTRLSLVPAEFEHRVKVLGDVAVAAGVQVSVDLERHSWRRVAELLLSQAVTQATSDARCPRGTARLLAADAVAPHA